MSPLASDQEPSQVQITFLDGTQAENTGNLATMEPHYKAEKIDYSTERFFDPYNPDKEVEAILTKMAPPFLMPTL